MTGEQPFVVRVGRPARRHGKRTLQAAQPASTALAPQPVVTALSTKCAAAVFLGGWCLLVLPDTLLGPLVPGSSLARAAVPVALTVLLGWEFLTRRRSHLPLTGWIEALAIVGLAASAFATVPILSLLKLILYLGLVAPLCLSREIATAFDGTSRTTWLLSGTAVVLIAVTAALLPVTGSGFFDNPNKAGMLTVFLWPWAAFLSLCAPRRWKWLGRAACVLAMAICVFAWSRGAMVGLLAAFVTYWALRQQPTITSVGFGLLGVACIALVAYLVGDEMVVDYAFKGRETFIDSTRLFMWEETIHYWKLRPIFGYGFGLSWTLHPDDAELVLQAGRMSWFTVEFGNSLLAILSGGGVALLAVLVGMFGTTLWRGLRTLQLVRSRAPERELLLLLIAAMSGMLVHAQAEAWLMSALSWSNALCFLYLGLIAHLSAQLLQSPHNRRQHYLEKP